MLNVSLLSCCPKRMPEESGSCFSIDCDYREFCNKVIQDLDEIGCLEQACVFLDSIAVH